MRVGIGLPSDATDEHFVFARQLGCDGTLIDDLSVAGVLQ